ncbi:hypothetical protein NP493_1238g00000 [Ridgeia piscesae]|uniref:G-protein coupled receptors family 1 profile domain-containing protein n=1 Tax=Ridgeia piscesae TaxID=27915 RepID=A0AAD9NH79_RIDPI|nr:hypothetical protein NP493_1238g00000 [Ridgeia piscesae]
MEGDCCATWRPLLDLQRNLSVTMNVSSLATSATPEMHYAGAEAISYMGQAYRGYHGYLAVTVCVIGILANVCNIVVLTRHNMVSATNCILTGLAISDSLTMVAYLPFALHFYCLYGTKQSPERNSLPAVRFLFFYACFSVVVHTVSIWLTVTLAVFRYISVRYPHYRKCHCSVRRAKLAILFVWLATLVVCVPNLLVMTINEMRDVTGSVWIVSLRMETPTERLMHSFNFWIQAVVVKLIPCGGLTVLSLLLLRTMKKVQRARRKMHMANCVGNPHRERATNRTTAMLLTVVVLFLITEFPQGIMSLLSGILPSFVDEVYGPLGDIMDIFVLINTSVNFVLYCTMSRDFRKTFCYTFCGMRLDDDHRLSTAQRTSAAAL